MLSARFKSLTGVDPGDLEPHQLWSPWIGHWFPAFTPSRMAELTLDQFVAMGDFVPKDGG